MPMQKRARVTRELLLVAAAQEICRVGYSDATLVAISAAAGVTTGALYFHFDAKEEIARALKAA
ncbi:TetR family transcriptional regulator [Agromyces aerolatus]|uniref:TetR family transcriptional regulator n=1 Tax=Agromyces sp. LY-1074 TaxID=3074080 RepID=UPI00285FE0B8|nr:MULTISPECIES: TetR family transcriptional regulator [unclassified Agromyces]MDR5701489.1 TetR family transcriptional regulator [Agromyces sp. LY-1074]MDR5704444.1 TetR family transcriptional regulator [Agromyces sp. LY-1358]